MRPLRLDLQGFTVFREPTTVDFTDADFFALVGPTGAGKSTVLDAICFALYGTVPRWGDRRRIENALAPSAAQARVRLVFEAGGARFVATRVVRRDGKGKVTTSHAGLEQLPPGYDLSTFDTAPAERGEAGLGLVLAGTPAEMDAAVLDAVGLPYDQFTSCVLLPQGEFAQFLHAKPAQRQEILVNLLGLHVYQQIGERAGVVARDAETRAAATRSLLGDLANADDAALRAGQAAVAARRDLVAGVERLVPALAQAQATGESARVNLSTVERELQTLSLVRAPAGSTGSGPSRRGAGPDGGEVDAGRLGEAEAAARTAAEQAEHSVATAEERDEKLRAEFAAAGDRTTLARLVDAYGERVRLAARVTDLATGVATAEAEHGKVAATLAAARATSEQAGRTVAKALGVIESAQTADRAGTLRQHLVAGQPCPVCEQDVAHVPPLAAPALAAARSQHAKAEKAAQTALTTVDKYDRGLRELDRALAAATAQHDESTRRLAALDATLAGSPTLAAAQSGLAALDTIERAAEVAGDAVRAARAAARTATARHRAAADAVRAAWRSFDQLRDSLAALGPPPADRDDLAQSWRHLREWAEATRADRTGVRDAALEQAQAALAELAELTGRLDVLCQAAGVEVGAGTGSAGIGSAGTGSAGIGSAGAGSARYQQAAALALQRAESALLQLERQREQAARLGEQAAGFEREALVARSLAQHLRADRFERWLLAEALDALVTGASRILRELTAGQYDLGHDKGDFYVVDHADGGLRRGVRTLSGGETFQTSLALALALSEQLAGLSTAAASLESILLDEGFGTLDASTLDTVAATLENLAARGDRMVGVVTHVTALAERIPVRFEVSRDAAGGAHVERYG